MLEDELLGLWGAVCPEARCGRCCEKLDPPSLQKGLRGELTVYVFPCGCLGQ